MDTTQKPTNLQSSGPFKLNSVDELKAYLEMWKSLCKKGIHYLDITTYPTKGQTDEQKLMKDPEFQQFRKLNSNADLDIYQTEVWLVESLLKGSEEDYHAYINLQKQVTRLLLYYSSSEEKINDCINQYVTTLDGLTSNYPTAKLLLDLFKKHALLTKNVIDETNFIRAILFRKLQFVNEVDNVLRNQSEFFKPDAPKIQKTPEFIAMQDLLVKDRDLDFAALNAIFSKPDFDVNSLELAKAPRLMSKAPKADYKSEYEATVKELTGVNEQLKEITLALRSTTTDGDREAYYDAIHTLNEKKDLLSYVADQQYKKSGLINKAEVSAKDWVDKNLFDKKKAGKDAAKVFFSTTGAALGKALLYKLTNQEHKLDSEKIKTDIVNGLIETGFTAIGTYFFGPLGGSFTKKMMPFFRDEPADPYLEEFGAIRQELSDGFTKMGTKLDKISSQITTELNAAVSKIEMHQDLSIRRNDFIIQKDRVISLFKKIENTYSKLYFMRNTHVFEHELSELDSQLQQEIIKLVSIFYHDDFDLVQDVLEPSDESLCGKFFKYNQEAAVSFHTTTRSLLSICEELVKIGKNYLDLREKWLATIGTTMLFFKQGKLTDPYSLFHLYWDAYKDRDDFSALLTVELEALRLSIIGSGNCLLLGNIERALDSKNGRIDFLAGFGLETVTESTGDNAAEKSDKQAELFEFEFEKETGSSGHFNQQPNREFISRYVVAAYNFESNAKSYYTIFTQQHNQIPIPIQVHLRIMPNDTIGIVHLETNKTYKARVLHPKESPELSDSLEAFFSRGETRTMVLKDGLFTKFSLPVKNQYIYIQYFHHEAEVKMTIHRTVNGSQKLMGEFIYPVNFSESYQNQVVQGEFKVELKPVINDKQALMELTVMRASDKKKGSVSIVMSDYAAMKKAGMSRGIDFVSTYRISMPMRQNGVTTFVNMPTDNLRPFASNLLLAGDEFYFHSDEKNHFGEVINGASGWHSLNGEYTLKAVNKNAWDVQLCSMKDTANQGSVFDKYTFQNNYSGRFIFQADGNFVMYDGNNKAIAATDTHSNTDFQKFAYLNNEGVLVTVSIDTKESRKHGPHTSPNFITDNGLFRILSNRLLPGSLRMHLAYDYRIESENGKYYAEFWRDEIDSGSIFFANSYEFSLLVRKQGGEIVKKVLKSGHISKGDVYPSTFLTMQKDGNLVAYQEKHTRTKQGSHVKRDPMFASGTNSKDNEGCALCLTNEGKLFLAKTEERKIIKWLAE